MDKISSEHIILASGSPRRRELLSKLGVEFEVISPKGEEIAPEGLKPVQVVEYLAELKASGIAACNIGIIIGADTVVEQNGRVLGKPLDRCEAARMLEMLSGKVHTVHTGVCIIDTQYNISICRHESTAVYFDRLTNYDIEEYIDSGEPFDKAGAYGIQGLGGKFVRRIEGCFYNVVGLPLNMLCIMLRDLRQQREKIILHA